MNLAHSSTFASHEVTSIVPVVLSIASVSQWGFIYIHKASVVLSDTGAADKTTVSYHCAVPHQRQMFSYVDAGYTHRALIRWSLSVLLLPIARGKLWRIRMMFLEGDMLHDPTMWANMTVFWKTSFLETTAKGRLKPIFHKMENKGTAEVLLNLRVSWQHTPGLLISFFPPAALQMFFWRSKTF